jgi:hypothetical protein
VLDSLRVEDALRVAAHDRAAADPRATGGATELARLLGQRPSAARDRRSPIVPVSNHPSSVLPNRPAPATSGASPTTMPPIDSRCSASKHGTRGPTGGHVGASLGYRGDQVGPEPRCYD